jgi:YVTN family beta-propeller protein
LTAALTIVGLIVVAAVGFVILSSSRSGSPSGTYKVAFQQIEAPCSPSFWGVPWAVTIGNVTKIQPTSAKLPIPYISSTTNRSLAEIDFFLRDGSYQYAVSPSQYYFTPSSGSLAVSGSNVTIPISYTGTDCIITTTSTASPGSPLPISSVEAANISIGGSPRTIAIDPSTNRVYVADFFYNNLTVVDSKTNSVVARIALPADDNNGIAVDPNTNMVYVLVEGGVAEVNGTTNKVAGELQLDFGAGSMAYDPSNHMIYGSNGAGNGSLVGADVRTGDVVWNTSLGYWANSLAVDPQTNVVFAVGCYQGFVCDSVVSVVDGTNGRILNKITLGNDAYPRVTMNLVTHVAYVSGSAQLVALNGTTGRILFQVNSMVCGPFDSMAADPSSNQLLVVSLDYNYVLAYDGTSGALLNMYSLPSTPQFVAFNSKTNEAYVTIGSQLLSFQNSAGAGHYNSALVGSGQGCPLP